MVTKSITFDDIANFINYILLSHILQSSPFL